jgi:hypothetical protein
MTSSHGGKKMWCIPTITPEFVERMEDVLDLYERPYDAEEPVTCLDETSKQLLKDTRTPTRCKPGKLARMDHEYERNGVRNIFMLVEPKGGYRNTRVTKRRTAKDFAEAVYRIANLKRYKNTKCLHIVLDNLNTHTEQSLVMRYGVEVTIELMNRIIFHYTPKHASWLDMAEIELSIMTRQCTKKRMGTERLLKSELRAWQSRRNKLKVGIRWSFTKEKAREKFKIGQN